VTRELTCGQRLAELSAVPAHLAAVSGTLAEVLEIHTAALDPSDPHALAERAAHFDAIRALREGAERLRAAAAELASSFSLPPARHHGAALEVDFARASIERYVDAQESLCALLRRRLESDRREGRAAEAAA
jgi:hypothetical protein